MKTILTFLYIPFLIIFCFASNENELANRINALIALNDATIGIGIYNLKTKDAFYVNGNRKFAMVSVVKFPQALAVMQQVDSGNLSLDQKVHFGKDDLNPDAYSPILKDIPDSSFTITLYAALSYTISKSDNNVCDKLFELLGGPQTVEVFCKKIGCKNTTVGTDYRNMGTKTIFANETTPEDMIKLLVSFFNKKALSRKSTKVVWQKLVETTTGPNRIKGRLPEGTIVGHKTGTSIRKNGLIDACNDVGIMKLPNGQHVAIVVFIRNSMKDVATNEALIANIAKVACEYFNL